MKKITLLLTVLLCAIIANATNYLNETFTGLSNGNINGQGSWTTEGTYTGGTGFTIGTGALIYSNGGGTFINSGVGNHFIDSITTSAVDYKAYKPFNGGTAVSTTVYLSFLLRVPLYSGSTNQELIGLASGTSAGPKVLIGKISTGLYKIGTVRGSSASADYKYAASPQQLSVGATYFIVMKYDFSTGDAGTAGSKVTGTSTVYVNPTIGSSSEGTAEISDGTSATTRASLTNLWVRQQGTVAAYSNISSIRVSSTWAEAVQGKLSTPSVATGATSPTSAGFTANWTTVANATGYDVYVYQNGNLVGSARNASGQSSSSLIISDLSAGTTYTYEVVAKGNSTNYIDSDPSSASATVTTSANTEPILTVGTLNGFGGQAINSTTGPNSFTITGTNLTSDYVTIGALSGYTYSTTSDGTYSSSLSIPQSGGSFSQTIYVKFTPTAAQSYNGNIAVGGGGATSVNCTATGAGVIGEPTTQASSVTFSNLISTGSTTGGFTINWTAGDGASHIVLVKAAGNVDANPVDATSYTANTAFGSGTQVGTGNYVVFSGTGTSVAITGLTKGTIYYIKVYTYNNGGGYENYLTAGPASANQQSIGSITSNNSGSGSWNSTGTWSGGVIPTQYDNVTITGSCIVDLNSNLSCNNLTINSGAKLWASASKTLTVYGTSLVCNGTLGDVSNTASLLNLAYGNNLSISGSGNIYPYRILPVTGLSNIGVTFNAPVTVTYGTVSILSENTNNDNDNITFNINSGVTVTIAGAMSTTSSQTGIGNGNVTLNVYGTLSIGGTFNTTVASGKTYTVNVYNGGLIEVAKTNSIKSFNICPLHAVQNANFNVNSGGEIKVYGNTDCSNTTYSGVVSGSGTFTLVSGGTISLSSTAGLDSDYGPIRTETRNFNSAANYSFVGTSAQQTGIDLPATMNNLTINNASGVTLGKDITVNGTLNLTAGTLNNNSNTVTLGNSATINTTLGTISTPPAFGAMVNFTYNGSAPVTLPGDFSGSATIKTLTVNNTAGITLTSNLISTDSLKIGTGGILNVNPGKHLTVNTSISNYGTLNLLSDENGTATYLDPSIISGTGTATVQQYLTAGRNWYMTIPVQTASTSNFSSAGSVVRYFEPTGAWFTQTVDSVLNPMLGYISAATTGTGTVSFTGTLNTGEKYINLTRTNTVAKAGFNLVGNPYPSYINWDAATKTNLESTVWFRSRNAGNTAYIFDTYNASTHVGTGLNGSALTTYIPPMQAFWVRVSAGQTTGRLTFNNTMRSHGSGTNKMKAPAATEQQVLRLFVSNGINEDEAVIVFNPNASNGFDMYDSQKQSNANKSIPEIFTLAGNEEVVINGLNSSSFTTEIPLGFRTGEFNNFSIRTGEMSNFCNNTHIILKDNLLNTETDLTNGDSYAFSSDIANNTSRFSLILKAPTTVTGTNNKTLNNNTICVDNNKQLIVQNPENSIESICIYNISGQLIGKISARGSLTKSAELKTGVYFVQIRNKNNESIVCKVKVD